MLFQSYNTCSFICTLIVLRKLWVVQGIHRTWKTKHASSARLQEGKKKKTISKLQCKKWVAFAYEGSNCSDLEKNLCFRTMGLRTANLGGRMLLRENFWDWSSLRCNLVHSGRLNLANAWIPYWTCNAKIFNKPQKGGPGPPRPTPKSALDSS